MKQQRTLDRDVEQNKLRVTSEVERKLSAVLQQSEAAIRMKEEVAGKEMERKLAHMEEQHNADMQKKHRLERQAFEADLRNELETARGRLTTERERLQQEVSHLRDQIVAKGQMLETKANGLRELEQHVDGKATELAALASSMNLREQNIIREAQLHDRRNDQLEQYREELTAKEEAFQKAKEQAALTLQAGREVQEKERQRLENAAVNIKEHNIFLSRFQAELTQKEQSLLDRGRQLDKRDEDLTQALEEVQAEIQSRQDVLQSREKEIATQSAEVQHQLLQLARDNKNIKVLEKQYQEELNRLSLRETELEKKETHLAKFLGDFA